jgi:hypothetical protein
MPGDTITEVVSIDALQPGIWAPRIYTPAQDCCIPPIEGFCLCVKYPVGPFQVYRVPGGPEAVNLSVPFSQTGELLPMAKVLGSLTLTFRVLWILPHPEELTVTEYTPA